MKNRLRRAYRAIVTYANDWKFAASEEWASFNEGVADDRATRPYLVAVARSAWHSARYFAESRGWRR
jgi:hypothetical protein